jgi:hypothetical protein
MFCALQYAELINSLFSLIRTAKIEIFLILQIFLEENQKDSLLIKVLCCYIRLKHNGVIIINANSNDKNHTFVAQIL